MGIRKPNPPPREDQLWPDGVPHPTSPPPPKVGRGKSEAVRTPSFRGTNEVRSLSILWPPSVNTYWRHIIIHGQQRSVLSKAAKEYRTNVGVAVLTQGRGATIDGPIVVEIVARPPDRRRRDLDNLLKGVLDALAHAGVYEDDSQIQDLRIRWGERVKLGRLEVLIQEVGE